MKHSFGSDNHSGVHPEIMKAIIDANQGYEPAYGDDIYTKKATEEIASLFGNNCEVYLVVNGTGANCTSISHMTGRFNSVICSDHAHIFVDECNAPEILSSCRLTTLPSRKGKISAEQINPVLQSLGNQHNPQPCLVSISQPTEFGTLYTCSEIREIAETIHSAGGFLHIDGARIANAAAAMGLSVKEITRDCGADILSFGGTKNGMMLGEAVIVFNDRIMNNDTFKYIRKQSAQLVSKMRYIGTQFSAYLKDSLFMKNAEHANAMARYMEKKLSEIDFIKIEEPVETNAVFAVMPRKISDILLKKHYFYIWDEERDLVRWMCSFSTRKEDIDDFVNDIMEASENI